MNKNDYLIHLSESERIDFGRVPFEEQSEQQKVFSSIWAVESQVNGGGFLGYFVSSDFDTANFAPYALDMIGAGACAEVVRRAIALLPDSALPDSQQACIQMVDSMAEEAKEEIEKLDSDFFAYPDDLTERLFGYVTSHPEAFGMISDTPKA